MLLKFFELLTQSLKFLRLLLLLFLDFLHLLSVWHINNTSLRMFLALGSIFIVEQRAKLEGDIFDLTSQLLDAEIVST